MVGYEPSRDPKDVASLEAGPHARILLRGDRVCRGRCPDVECWESSNGCGSQ